MFSQGGLTESTCTSHDARQPFKESSVSMGHLVYPSSVSYVNYSILHAQL